MTVDLFIQLLLGTLFLCVFIEHRRILIQSHRLEVIDWIFEGDCSLMDERAIVLHKYSFNKMIFMLHKWTFKQFYPEVGL